MEENVQSSPKNVNRAETSPYLQLIKNPSKNLNNTKAVVSIGKSPTEVTELFDKNLTESSKATINLQSQIQINGNKSVVLSRQNASNSGLRRDQTGDSILSMKKSETDMEGFKDMLSKSFA